MTKICWRCGQKFLDYKKPGKLCLDCKPQKKEEHYAGCDLTQYIELEQFTRLAYAAAMAEVIYWPEIAGLANFSGMALAASSTWFSVKEDVKNEWDDDMAETV